MISPSKRLPWKASAPLVTSEREWEHQGFGSSSHTPATRHEALQKVKSTLLYPSVVTTGEHTSHFAVACTPRLNLWWVGVLKACPFPVCWRTGMLSPQLDHGWTMVQYLVGFSWQKSMAERTPAWYQASQVSGCSTLPLLPICPLRTWSSSEHKITD